MRYYNFENLKKECSKMKKPPYLRIVCGNRTSGKTTASIIESLKLFKEKKKQTVFFYRTKTELRASHFLYQDVIDMYPDFGVDSVETKSLVSDLIYGVYANISGESFLIAFSLWIKKPDRIKKFSPMFRDVELGIFDEFLLEDEREYIEGEVEKLQSICVSIGRGGGKQSRPFYLYLLSNRTNLCNPYFVNFGILNIIQKGTKFIRGENFIVEFSYNDSAKKALSNNELIAGLSGNDKTYINYAIGDDELVVSSEQVIKKFKGRNRYYATIFIDSKAFAVRDFYSDDSYYISKKIDESCTNVYYYNSKAEIITNINNKAFLLNLHKLYKSGVLFFDSAETRGDVIQLIGKALFKR